MNDSHIVNAMHLSYLLVVAFAAFAVAKNEEFPPSLEGMEAFSIVPDTAEKLSLIRSLEVQTGFDFLKFSGKINDPVDVLVTGDKVSFFKTLLEDYDIKYSSLVENVKEELDKDFATRQIAYFRRQLYRPTNIFDDFLRYDEIINYLKNISKEHNDIVSLIQIGYSYEGRPMYAVKISKNNNKKPAILLDAGIHAREWISTATSLYLIDQLVENKKINAGMYNNTDWYVIPVLNPDGYEYSHTDYRLWRKSRSNNSQAVSRCQGVDLNRNFDHYWMVTGASSEPCSETYAGRYPSSEIETRNLRNFVLAHNDSIELYLTLHSYGQYILYPWGYTSSLPSNAAILHALGESAGRAINSYRGTRYVVGSSTNVLYAAAGGSDDYVKGVAGVDLAYTIELPGGGTFGFNIPPSEIIPVGRETFEGIKTFARYLESRRMVKK